MKIALLCRSMPCHQDGGMEYHTVTLATELAHLGHQIQIITTGHEGNICPRQYSLFEVIHLPDTLPGTYTSGYYWQLWNYLNTHPEIDLVHSQGFAGFSCLYGTKQPLVSTIHGTLTSETTLYYNFSWKAVWKYRKRLAIHPFYRKLLQKSKALIVDSYFSRDLISSECPQYFNKIQVIPLGVGLDFFNVRDISECRSYFNIPDDQFILLCLGRITESKGFQTVVDALPLLSDIPMKLVIAGTGPYENQLKEQAASLKLNNITFLGRIQYTDIARVYNLADIFIQPDMTAPAFGLVIAESLACGTPVIASRTGASPEILSSDCGYLFPKGDATHLARMIRSLYKETNIRKGMSMKARIHAVKRYDSKRMAGEVENVYKQVLS